MHHDLNRPMEVLYPLVSAAIKHVDIIWHALQGSPFKPPIKP